MNDFNFHEERCSSESLKEVELHFSRRHEALLRGGNELSSSAACCIPANTWSRSGLQLDNDIISTWRGPNHINPTLPPCLAVLRHGMHMSDSDLPREGGLWGMRNCSLRLLGRHSHSD